MPKKSTHRPVIFSGQVVVRQARKAHVCGCLDCQKVIDIGDRYLTVAYDFRLPKDEPRFCSNRCMAKHFGRAVRLDRGLQPVQMIKHEDPIFICMYDEKPFIITVCDDNTRHNVIRVNGREYFVNDLLNPKVRVVEGVNTVGGLSFNWPSPTDKLTCPTIVSKK